MIRMQVWPLAVVVFICQLFAGSFIFAQPYKAQIGFDKLKNEVGPTLANGSGITVAIVEPNVGAAGTNTYFPLVSDPEFSSKTFLDVSNLSPRNTSEHANIVGKLFFGAVSSMTPGITNVQVYDADNFIFVRQALGTVNNPAPRVIPATPF